MHYRSRFNEDDFIELVRDYDINIAKEYDVDTLNLIINKQQGKIVNQSVSILKK